MEHTNFLSYYYSNESAGSNATVMGSGGLATTSGGKGVGVKKNDDDLVEGGKGDDGGATGATTTGNIDGEEGGAIKEGGDASSLLLPSPAKTATMATLRNFCSKYPKSRNKHSGKNDSNSRHGVKKEEEEEEELMVAKELMEASSATADTTTTAAATAATTNDATTATPQGPQVEVVNGEIVIAQDSLLSHPTTRTSTEQIDKEFGTVVEDETPTRLGAINARYDSYVTKPRSRPQRWSADETKSFYRALRQCGTDFSMMQMFLPGRTRSQLKSKYKLELRKNGRLVDMALDPKSKLRLDLSVFGDGLEIPESVTPTSRV
ncbi:hypothetical protein ACHAWC_000638, partial [Mediolabrus comicus]